MANSRLHYYHFRVVTLTKIAGSANLNQEKNTGFVPLSEWPAVEDIPGAVWPEVTWTEPSAGDAPAGSVALPEPSGPPSTRDLAQAFDLGHGLGTVDHVQLLEDALDMVFDREGADVQDHADFLVGFAVAHPLHDFQLAGA